MRKRASMSFLWILAASAAAQQRLEVRMPPNSRQAGQSAFANRCPSNQTYQVTALPAAGWLHLDPATVDVPGGTAFDVRITANTSGMLKPGTYQTSLMVLCATCASTDPPCLQGATELPITLTVADIKKPSEFELVADPAAPTSDVNPNNLVRRSPVLQEPVPPESVPARAPLMPLAAGGVLILGGLGVVLARKGKSSTRRRTRVAEAEETAETERHRVSW
jgi:hypothetical protein